MRPIHISKVSFSVLLYVIVAFATSAQAQLLEEVSFITSPDNVTLEMLSSAGGKHGDHVIDLVG